MSPLVSVITLNFNGLRHLQVVLDSLEHQSYPRDHYEIVFADNGSTDTSVAFVKAHYPQVRILQFDKNYGFAEGNNLAAKETDTPVLAFINNDTEVDYHWLEELMKAYHEQPEGIYGSQAYQFDHRDMSANSVAKLMAWGIPTNINVYKPRTSLSMQKQETLYADAAGMLLAKKLFLDLGGFDPSYFAYEEEKDLGWKAWLRGHPSYVIPSSIYYHKGGATLGQSSNRAIMLLWRNGLRNLVKYPSGRLLWTMIPLHIGYSLASYIIIFIPAGRWSLGWSMLSAYGQLLWNLPSLLKKRGRLQRQRVISDQELSRRGLILGLGATWFAAKSFLGRRPTT